MLNGLFNYCLKVVSFVGINSDFISNLRFLFFLPAYNYHFFKQPLTSFSIAKKNVAHLLGSGLFALSTGPITITKLYNLLLIKGRFYEIKSYPN